MQNIFEKKAKWGQCGNRTRWRPLVDATVSMIWWLDFVSHMVIQKQTSQGNFGCMWHFFSPQGAVISTPLGLKSYLPICRSKIYEVCVPPRQKTKYTHMEKLHHQQVQLEFSEQGSFFQETWKTGPEPSKHHQLCNCVNKIINDSMIKRVPMTLGLFGCIRTCAHRRVRRWVTEDFWNGSTVWFRLSAGGKPTASVRSKTPMANRNACLVYGNQEDNLLSLLSF